MATPHERRGVDVLGYSAAAADGNGMPSLLEVDPLEVEEIVSSLPGRRRAAQGPQGWVRQVAGVLDCTRVANVEFPFSRRARKTPTLRVDLDRTQGDPGGVRDDQIEEPELAHDPAILVRRIAEIELLRCRVACGDEEQEDED